MRGAELEWATKKSVGLRGLAALNARLGGSLNRLAKRNLLRPLTTREVKGGRAHIEPLNIEGTHQYPSSLVVGLSSRVRLMEAPDFALVETNEVEFN